METAVPEWLPLGPMQVGLLLQELKQGARAVPPEQLGCYWNEAVDEPALRRAWEVLLARHEALRAGFDPVQPLTRCQFFLEEVALPWDYQDFTGLSPTRQEEQWQAVLATERAAGFPLERPPLFRLRLFRFAERAYRLVLTYHPLLLDVDSLTILFKELHQLYDLDLSAEELAVPTSYRQHLKWLAEWQATSTAELQAYWASALGDFETPTLPQLPEPEAEAVTDASPCWRVADADLVRALRECAASLEVSVADLAEAAWILVLGGYSGNGDLLFGSLKSCRSSHAADLERAVGLFVNLVARRVCLTQGETVGDFIRRLRRQVPEQPLVEQVPLAAVHGWSGIPPHRPLFETLFVAEETSRTDQLELAWGAVSGRRVEAPGRAPFPLTLTATKGGAETLSLELAFDAARFDRDAVERMADDLVAVLRQLPVSLDRPLEEVSLLAPAHAALLRDWNRTDTEFPAGRLLHEWVEAAADQNPEAAAVQGPDGLFTYRQLDIDANRLAHRLRDMGVGRNQFVALLLRRSAHAVAALLGVLKSGAAYLPLDPDAPADRLRFQLEDSGASAVIVDGETRELLSPNIGTLICLDWDREAWALQPVTRLRPLDTATDLCYGIYTSGSTGTPKLIGVEHRNAANLLAFATRQVLSPDDVRYVPFTDSLSGDACVHQIFATLANGGTLVLVDNSLEVSASPFFSRFTYFGSTPTLLASMLANGGLPPAVRTVGLGAEPIPDELVDRLAALDGVEQVFNFYGPTEATVYCTLDRVIDRRRGIASGGSGTEIRSRMGSWSIIGRPIANTTILILDELGRPTPLGVTGEIYVGGAGVARGYPKLPEQTRQRFLTTLSAGEPETRYYRTGDLGRFRTDGRIEFLGRADDQVKIRGYRIEPGEVTAVLKQLPGIRDAAVIASREAGETRLVAYYVTASADLGPGELRAAAAQSLPAHFLPSAFVRLPALPLTASGKLDRRALPAPSHADLPGASVTEPPRDELEVRVARLWQRILRRPQIGLRDSFFDLGGHSFLAVTLLAEIEKELGCRLPLTVFVQSPTVEGMAAALRAGSVRSSWQALVPLQPTGSHPPFFAVHGIGGGVLCFRDLARHLGPEQPFFGLQAVTLGGAEREYDRIEAMAAHYLREVRTVQPEGPYSLGGLSFGGIVALEMAQQLLQAGEEVASLVLLDANGPGYPRFPGWSTRVQAHARHFRALDRPSRKRYLRVRAQSVYDLVRRRLLAKCYRPTQEAHLPRALADIGIAHLSAAYHYQHRAYPGMITLLRAAQQPIGCLPNPSGGWDRLSTGGLQIETVPGDHASLLQEPHVEVLADTLSRILTRARSPA